MACENSSCYERFAKARAEHNLTFRQIVRRRKQWFLEDKDAPGAADEPIQPGDADADLRGAVLEPFLDDDGALIEEHHCKEAGCVCEYAEDAEPQMHSEDVRQEFNGIDQLYIRREEVSSPDWNETPPKMFRSDGTQVTDYNPVVHTLELKSREPLVYWLRVKYLAVVSFDLTIDVWELVGTCKPNVYYIADRERDPGKTGSGRSRV